MTLEERVAALLASGEYKPPRELARAIIPLVQADMRERCISAVQAVAINRNDKACCGHGVGNPPECCGDPLYMISAQEAEAAIRALPTPSKPARTWEASDVAADR